MKLNQKGFSAVEILIVIVVITLVGFVGWRVYDSNQNTSEVSDETVRTVNQQDSSATGEQDETEEKVSMVPDSWVEFRDTKTNISFWHPSEWGSLQLERIESTLEGKSGLKYEGSFSNMENLRVTYSEEDYGLLGGGCALSRVHIVNSIRSINDLREDERIITTSSNEGIVFREGSYFGDDYESNGGCIDAEDYDLAIINTANEQFPAAGIIYIYDSTREASEQAQFLEIIDTVTINQ